MEGFELMLTQVVLSCIIFSGLPVGKSSILFTNLFMLAEILVVSLIKMFVSSIQKKKRSGKKFTFSVIFPLSKVNRLCMYFWLFIQINWCICVFYQNHNYCKFIKVFSLGHVSPPSHFSLSGQHWPSGSSAFTWNSLFVMATKQLTETWMALLDSGSGWENWHLTVLGPHPQAWSIRRPFIPLFSGVFHQSFVVFVL